MIGVTDTSGKVYQGIVKHYENCLQKYGDNHRGVDWPNREDTIVRYQIMLDIIPKKASQPFRVLDFGCGLSHLYGYIHTRNMNQHIEYAGLDISPKFIEFSKKKYPHIQFYCMDILDNSKDLPDFDYIILNGVLTEKCDLTYNQMWDYAKRLISAVFEKATCGIAFNAMSADVDWQRDDLFHLPFDTLSRFLLNSLKTRFIIRKDYGLYEYTTYLFKGISQWPG